MTELLPIEELLAFVADESAEPAQAVPELDAFDETAMDDLFDQLQSEG